MRKTKVLDIVAWWPRADTPSLGLFIKEHIASTEFNAEHQILHVTFEKSWFHVIPQIEHQNSGAKKNVHLITVKSAIRRFGLHDLLLKLAFSRWISRIQKQFDFDLIHFHVRTHITKLAIDHCKKLSTPAVLTEHFSFYHHGINSLSHPEQNAEVQQINRQLNSDFIKLILPVSKQFKSTLIERYGIDEQKIGVIPNIAHSIFNLSPAITRKALHFVCCANWNESKDPWTLFKAITELPKNFQSTMALDIIGGGILIPEMKDYCEQHLPDVTIVFHGFQPKQFIAEKLKSAVALVHSTNYENLPTIIVESLCCGTPVVSMNVNGVPELVNEKNGILIEKGDLDGMKKALIEITQRDFEHERISQEAIKKYSSKAVGRSIIDAYARAMSA